MKEMQEIYLDNAATTKPCTQAVEALTHALAEEYGNASSVHARGIAARRLLEESRAIVAQALGVQPAEIYFTSGATEANNLAIRGAAEARGPQAGAIVTSDLEHPSVTRSVRGMRRMGWTTRHIPAVGGDFDLTALERELEQPVQLVTVMQVQNELGYIFPIEQIARLAKEKGFVANSRESNSLQHPLVHCDATQALGKLEVAPVRWGVDLVSVAAHKLGGPKGVGALYVKRGTKMFTTSFGGGQERGLRSGTEAVFLAAGFAAALKQAVEQREKNYTHVQQLKERLVAKLRDAFPAMVLHSREDGTPYIVAFALPGISNEYMVRQLSDRGIYISRSSACTYNRHTVPEGTWREKHPLSMQAAGISEDLAASTLRISFCPSNTSAHIDSLVAALQDIVE